MKYCASTVIWLVATLICSLSFAQKVEKYALLIGVTKYEHAQLNSNPLKFPEADATSVADLLKASGYTVDVLLGKTATQTAIKAALSKAGKQGTQDGAVLIGLFGHGVQYGMTAYYCPFDASIREVKDSKGNKLASDDGELLLEPDPETLVVMSDILKPFKLCGASNRILLADCCRDDPNRARGRSPFGTALKIDDLPIGTVALFACSKNEQAFEHDDWQHGAFTYAFLKHAKQLANRGKVTSGELSDKMFSTVKKIVTNKTNGNSQQTVYILNSGRVNLLLKSIYRPAMTAEEKRKRREKAFQIVDSVTRKMDKDVASKKLEEDELDQLRRGLLEANCLLGRIELAEDPIKKELEDVISGIKQAAARWKGLERKYHGYNDINNTEDGHGLRRISNCCGLLLATSNKEHEVEAINKQLSDFLSSDWTKENLNPKELKAGFFSSNYYQPQPWGFVPFASLVGGFDHAIRKSKRQSLLDFKRGTHDQTAIFIANREYFSEENQAGIAKQIVDNQLFSSAIADDQTSVLQELNKDQYRWCRWPWVVPFVLRGDWEFLFSEQHRPLNKKETIGAVAFALEQKIEIPSLVVDRLITELNGSDFFDIGFPTCTALYRAKDFKAWVSGRLQYDGFQIGESWQQDLLYAKGLVWEIVEEQLDK